MAQPFPDMLEMLDGGDASAELTSTFDAIKEEMLERVRAIAEQMLFTLGGSDIGVGLFASGGGGVWVRERQIAGHA